MKRSPITLLALAAFLAPTSGWSQTAPAAPATPAASAAPATASITGRRRVPDTIMFTIDELQEIQSRLRSGATVEEEKNAVKSLEAEALYLSSILYYSPTEWTVWINGQPIGPAQDFQTFQITSITPQYIELLVPLSAQGMRPIKLEPNQTFVADSGVVIEGPWQ